METRKLLNRIRVALATAAVGSLLMTSATFAQSSQMVRVDTPTNGYAGLGNFP